MLRVLVRVEALKLSRSLGFWGAFCVLGGAWGVAGLQIAREVARDPNRSFDLGTAIPLLVGNLGGLALLFVATGGVLLTSMEYVSGTARYAVIRGLRRHEVVLGKLLQVLLLAAAVGLLTILVTIGVAMVAGEPRTGPTLTFGVAGLLASYAVALIEYGALGVMAGTLIRHSGIAPVALLAYLLLGETAVAEALSTAGVPDMAEWLPAGSGTALLHRAGGSPPGVPGRWRQWWRCMPRQPRS